MFARMSRYHAVAACGCRKTASPYVTWAYWWLWAAEPVLPLNASSRADTDTRVHPRYTGGIPEALRAEPFRRFRATGLPDRHWRISQIVSAAPAGPRPSSPCSRNLHQVPIGPSSRSGLDLPVSVFAPCLLGCPGTGWQQPSLSGTILYMSGTYLRWYGREGAGSSGELWNTAADS